MTTRAVLWASAMAMLIGGCTATQPTVLPSSSPKAQPSASVSMLPTPTLAPTRSPGAQTPEPSTILFAAADGLRLRSEASPDAAAIATIRAGQVMGMIGGPVNSADMAWYEIRIGPGDLRGWVAAGPGGEWLREVRNGSIAFGCDACVEDDDPATIGAVPATVTAEADGAGPLAAIAFGTTTHAWSPDGTQMAVTLAGADSTTIGVVDAAGGEVRELGWGHAPSWSPTGERLAWLRTPGPGGVTPEDLRSVLVLATAGSWATIETPIGMLRGASAVAWSPDGSRLATSGMDCRECPDGPIAGDPPSAIFTVTVGGYAVRQLTSGSLDGDPSWSPDGRQVTFMRYDLGSGVAQALVVSADGGDPTPLYNGAASHAMPAWSPDGTRLAVGTEDGVVVSDGAGANASVLVSGVRASGVRWSPDGQDIAFVAADADGSTGAWVVPADGTTEPRRISPEGTQVGVLAWQPVLVNIGEE